jgi:hypothetical protein
MKADQYKAKSITMSLSLWDEIDLFCRANQWTFKQFLQEANRHIVKHEFKDPCVVLYGRMLA